VGREPFPENPLVFSGRVSHLLSSTGLAYRRCELAWVNGEEIGVNFLKNSKKKKAGKS
jgi:hypothetical protein